MRDDPRLSKRAAKAIGDTANEILISSVVGWEVSIKAALGKITPQDVVKDLEEIVASRTFEERAITLKDAIRSGMLAPHHRDPFDRMLAAQALESQIPILSADRVFDKYRIERIW